MSDFNALKVAFLPQRCMYCGEVVEFDKCLCDNCKTLPKIEDPVCTKCGLGKEFCCCDSIRQNVEYKGVVAPFYYEGQISKAILRLKGGPIKSLAKTYAPLMAQCVKKYYADIRFDCVTFIPMSKRDERRRGFNQARLLAELVAKECHLPVEDLLVKAFKTEKQKGTAGVEERFANMYAVFDLKEGANVDGKTILLVDDTKTTGATLSSGALTLNAYGAKAVYATAIAAVKMKEKPKGNKSEENEQ